MKNLLFILFSFVSTAVFAQSIDINASINAQKPLNKLELNKVIKPSMIQEKINAAANRSSYLANNYLWNSFSNTWYKIDSYKYLFSNTGKFQQGEYLDSNMNVLSRQTNEYDLNDSLLSSTTEERIFGKMVFVQRQHFGYDAAGRATSILVQLYDTTTSTWKDASRVSFTFNNLNKLESYINEEFINGAWVISFAGEYNYYTTNTRIDSVVSSAYNTYSKVYEPKTKYTYLFNNNLITNQYVYEYDTAQSAWSFFSGVNYYYENTTAPTKLERLSKIDSNIYLDYRLDSITWHNWQGISFLSEDNEIAGYVLNGYIDSTTNLYPLVKYQKIYKDNFGSHKISEYLIDSTHWSLNYSFERNFDSQRNITFEETRINDAGVIKIINSAIFTHTYDANNQLTQSIIQAYDPFNNVYINSYKTEYSLITGIKTEKTNNIFSVYPNPNTGEFFIEFKKEIADVKIYNSFGQKIKEVSADDTPMKIVLEEKGLYLIEVGGVIEKIIVR